MALRYLKELQKQADGLSPDEQIQLANYLLAKAHDSPLANGTAFMQFFGKIDFKGDPMDIQRKMRSEWPE